LSGLRSGDEESINITYSVTVEPEAKGQIVENIAFIDGTDPLLPPTEVAILGISKTANTENGDDTAKVGEEIEYTITVTNPSAKEISDFLVEDKIDINLVEFVEGSLKIDGVEIAITPDKEGLLSIPLAELLEGDTVITFSVTVLEAAAGQTVKNTAILKGPEEDGERPPFGADEVEVGIDPIAVTFNVFYYGMGHDDGTSPPEDKKDYAEGDEVDVLHHGEMTKAGHVFIGWHLADRKLDSFTFNTAIHALYKFSDILYLLYEADPSEVFALTQTPLETFTMLAGDAHLHAIWEPEEEDQVDPTTPTLSKSASRTTAAVSDTIIYTLTVHNPNADTLLDFVAVDRLNTSLVNFDIASVRINGAAVAEPNSVTFSASVLHVNLAELPEGNTVITFSVTVLPAAAGITVRNSAILEGSPNGNGDRPVSPPTKTVEVDVAGTPADSGKLQEHKPPRLIPTLPHQQPVTPRIPFITPPVELPPINELFIEDHIWYVRGDTENNVRPDGQTSRADVAIVFYRLLRPEWKAFEPEGNLYTDVVGDEWYGKAIGILTHYGIIEGYPDGSFKPLQPITRKEFAAVVSRFDNLEESLFNPYTDLDPNDWAYKYIISATAKGWFIGHGGRFRPDANLTRAEMVTAINRILRRRILITDIPADVHKFFDLDESHWAYADIMEAAHTHTYVRKADGTTELWIEIIDTGLAAPYNE